jgi:hypothetical protein
VLELKPGTENSFGYAHRDYCGDTVFCVDGTFYVGPQGPDGYPPVEGDAYISFASVREFIDWISVQSDDVFSGRVEGPLKKDGCWIDNQTLSVTRIQKYCDNYLPQNPKKIVVLEFDGAACAFTPKDKATGESLLSYRINMAGLKQYGVVSVADYECKYLKKEFPTCEFEYVLPDGTSVDRTQRFADLTSRGGNSEM